MSKTFEINGKEFAVSKNRKLIGKTTFGPADWGISAWLPVQHNEDVVSDQPDTSLNLGNFPKIPFDTLLLVREFFAEVYEVHKSEAFVYMHYDRENGKYEIVVPPDQVASAGHVKFDSNVRAYCGSCNIAHPSAAVTECMYCGGTDIHPTFLVGTLHSHGSMGAFHSATDDENELNMTGFHITIGKVDNRHGFELAHSFCVAKRGFVDSAGKGVRFKNEINVRDLIELPFPQQRQMIQRWVSLVVSTPALTYYPKERPLLMLGNEIVSMFGNTQTYTTMMQRAGAATGETIGPATYKIIPISELEDYRKALTNESVPAIGQNTSQVTTSTVGGVVVTRKKTPAAHPGGQDQADAGFRKKPNAQQQSQALRKRLTFTPPSLVKIREADLVISVDAERRIRFARISPADVEETWYLSFSAMYHGLDDAHKVVCMRYVLDEIETCMLQCVLDDSNKYEGGPLLQQHESLIEGINTVVGVVSTHITEYEKNHIIKAPKPGAYYAAAGKTIADELAEAFQKLNLDTAAKRAVVYRDKDKTIFALLQLCWCIQEVVRATEVHEIYPTHQLLELVTLLQDDLIQPLCNIYNSAKILESVS